MVAPSRPLARVGGLIGGRYRVIRKLGAGGFGEVYEAFHIGTHKPAALKLLRADVQEQKGAIERFTAEARVSASLCHPNTVRVFDFGSTPDGDLYLAMELLQGQVLEKLLTTEGRLDPKRAARIAIQMLKSLNEAHNRGLVHRDIKPDNVFLCDIDGEADFVKVIDFGIAKLTRERGQALTQSGVAIGTPHYMSPEQIRASDLDGRADLYSLGIMLYRCLAGRLPFDAASGLAIVMAHMTEAPPRLADFLPGIDPVLEGIVMRSLEKDRDRRFASAAAMREALEAWGERVQTPVRVATGGLPALDNETLDNADVLTPERIEETLRRQRAALNLQMTGARTAAAVPLPGRTERYEDAGPTTPLQVIPPQPAIAAQPQAKLTPMPARRPSSPRAPGPEPAGKAALPTMALPARWPPTAQVAALKPEHAETAGMPTMAFAAAEIEATPMAPRRGKGWLVAFAAGVLAAGLVAAWVVASGGEKKPAPPVDGKDTQGGVIGLDADAGAPNAKPDAGSPGAKSAHADADAGEEDGDVSRGPHAGAIQPPATVQAGPCDDKPLSPAWCKSCNLARELQGRTAQECKCLRVSSLDKATVAHRCPKKPPESPVGF